jgi:exonuclease VII large subunit
MIEEDQKKADGDYVLSADWADKPSEAAHIEMSVDEVGKIQPVDLSKKEVPKVAELSPECAGPVGGAVKGAFEINRIFHELSPELIAALDKTLGEEERDHDDLVSALVKVIDMWGRQEIDKIKAEVHNKVRTYMSMEGTDVQEARQRCRETKKRLKAETKKSMKAIQERLNAALKTLTADLDTDIEVLRMKYKDMYARSEACLKRDTDRITERVASLIGPLQEMSVEQLLELKQGGVVPDEYTNDKQQEDS